MSSWGKKAMAWLGFKSKGGSKVQQPKAVRTNVGGSRREEEIASAMMEDLDERRKRGGKSQIDFSGLLGGGGRGLG
jgi:hypothetical protein